MARTYRWDYRQEDIDAIAGVTATAVARGIEVPRITPILPDYLHRLDGFVEWRRRLEAALPRGVRLRDHSRSVRSRRFRDDLHLNRRGVLQLMSSLRRDRVPGFF